MKTRFLSIVFLLTMINTAFCQKVNVGIKAGTDLGKITGKSFDEEFKFGYHVGAFVEVKVKKIGVQPEVYFSQVNAQNGKNINSILSSSNIVNTKIKLSYLNIPILINMYFTQNVALQVGPQFGLVLNETNTKNINVGQTAEDAFKKGDFSLTGGLQVKISKFRIYGRYVVGLSDVNNSKSSTYDEKWKNQVVHLGIGYAIL